MHLSKTLSLPFTFASFWGLETNSWRHDRSRPKSLSISCTRVWLTCYLSPSANYVNAMYLARSKGKYYNLRILCTYIIHLWSDSSCIRYTSPGGFILARPKWSPIFITFPLWSLYQVSVRRLLNCLCILTSCTWKSSDQRMRKLMPLLVHQELNDSCSDMGHWMMKNWTHSDYQNTIKCWLSHLWCLR